MGKIWERIKSVILSAVERIKAWWEQNGEKVINAVVKALKSDLAEQHRADFYYCTYAADEFADNQLSTIFKKIWKIAVKIWGTVKDIVIDAVKGIRKFWEKTSSRFRR